MRLSRFQMLAHASMMVSSMMMGQSTTIGSIGTIPSPINRKGELKKDFKHNERKNIRTKPKAKAKRK